MLAVLAVASLVSAPPKGFFKIPMFYNNSDCAGEAVELSQNFSRMSLVDRRWMNVLDYEYLPSWGTGTCLRVLTTATGDNEIRKDIDRKAAVAVMKEVPSRYYSSVKFSITQGECASGGSASMLMYYYSRHANCGGESLYYNLSAGQCTNTPFGYAKWESTVTNATELCTVQQWFERANSGRVVTHKFSNPNCTGNHYQTVIEPLLGEYCSEDHCDGCCPAVDSQNKCEAEKTPANVQRYEKALQACTKVNGSDVFFMAVLPFQDEECTIPDHTTDLNRTIVKMNECLNIETPARNYSMRTSLSNIGTADHCAALEVGVRHGISPEWVTYNEMLGQLSDGAAQQQVSLFATVLLVILMMLQ